MSSTPTSWIWDYLRLLYARIGIPHCPSHGLEVRRQTPQQIVDQVLELTEEIRLDRYFQHSIEVVVDRLVRKEGIEQRLTQSLETARAVGSNWSM